MRKTLTAILALLAYSEGARILAFFPLGAKSHHYVFRPIIEALGKRGHDVVYVTGYPYQGDIPSGIEQINLFPHIPNFKAHINVMDLVDDNVFRSLMKVYNLGVSIAPHLLGNGPVQELIHSEREFDAVLIESYFIQEYHSALIHRFNAIGIEIMPLGDSCWMNELAGLPCNPSFQLDYKSELTPNMDFFQRLYNTYVVSVVSFIGYYHLPKMQEIIDRYFNYTGWESRPSIQRLLSNRSLILTNSHFAVGYPVPLSPNRKEIGGVHILQRNTPLPKDIQSFMDANDKGVVYFSLGSNVRISDPANDKIREVFMKVFEDIPQGVLMKWETNFNGNLPKNVKLEKWFPQQDVLAHNNCVLFITHGGYLSLTEAVHFGVPVIGIPFFADQPKNVLFLEQAGIGKALKIPNITYESVSKTVKEVLSNRRYKDEIQKMSKMFKDRPLSPVDEAVYWVEYAIKYPNVLIPKGAGLSYIQLHLVDLNLFMSAIICLLIFISWKIFIMSCKMFTCEYEIHEKLKDN